MVTATSQPSTIQYRPVTIIRTVSDHCDGPLSIIQDVRGRVYVTQEFGHRVTIYDADLTITATFGSAGSGPGEFMYPTGIAVDRNGYVYVTDRWNHRVQKFDAAGRHLASWGQYGDQPGEFSEPWGITINAVGDIVVVDRGNARLQVFDSTGTVKRQFGTRGTALDYYAGEQFKHNFHFQQWLRNVSRFNSIESCFVECEYDVGDLDYPESVSIDEAGMIYVTDRVSGHVALFDAQYALQGFLRHPGNSGQMFEPTAVIVTPHAVVYAEELSGMIYVSHAGGCDAYNLQEHGMHVSGIWVDQSNGCIYVSDAWHNTLSIVQCEIPL